MMSPWFWVYQSPLLARERTSQWMLLTTFKAPMHKEGRLLRAMLPYCTATVRTRLYVHLIFMWKYLARNKFWKGVNYLKIFAIKKFWTQTHEHSPRLPRFRKRLDQIHVQATSGITICFHQECWSRGTLLHVWLSCVEKIDEQPLLESWWHALESPPRRASGMLLPQSRKQWPMAIYHILKFQWRKIFVPEYEKRLLLENPERRMITVVNFEGRTEEPRNISHMYSTSTSVQGGE